MSVTLPSSQLSNVPWRRAGVKYTTNDIFLDLTEEVDAIIDKSGATVTAEIQGYVSTGTEIREGRDTRVLEDGMAEIQDYWNTGG